MKKITITNAKEATETGENEDKRLCKFEIEGPEEMDASDGYHTFTELYEHRIVLFLALCRYFIQGKASYDSRNVWCSLFHHDGTCFEGWFIMGIGKEKGNQITYHLPMKYWPEASHNAEVLEKALEWDGHTSDDVIKRLNTL